MTPVQYEREVARHFELLGYSVETTRLTNDGGVDLFASRGDSRIAIQAKMYGQGRRPVNRAMVFELHGAAAFFDCDAAVLATNGRCLPNAEEAASKLGVELFQFDPESGSSGKTKEVFSPPAQSLGIPSAAREAFDSFWKLHVMPLKGKSLEYQLGKSNKIIEVNWAGLTRISSRNGPPQTVGIEIFRRAFGELVGKGRVTRDWINAEYPGRASSIIIRVLAQNPHTVLERSPMTLALRST